MRICFVNPPVARVVERDYDAPRYPNETLATLAAYCRAQGHDCCVIDAKRERLDAAAVIRRCRAADPQVVACTAFTHEIAVAGELAAAVKTALPTCRTVVGGYHVTPLPEPTLREFPGFDFGIVGEGELPLAALLTALAAGTPVDTVAGLAFRRGDNIIVTPPGPTVAALDTLPFPAFDLLPPSDYYIVSTARGCPFACPFCLNLHGRQVRTRDPHAVAAWLDELVRRYQPRELMFGNENFLLAGSRPETVLTELAGRGFATRTRWQAQTHVSTVTPELLALAQRAGCYKLAIGVETGNDALLAALGKGLDRDSVRTAVRLVKQAGLEIELNFVLGLPGETEQSLRETIDFLVELNPTLPAIGIMVPYPGTAVAAMAARGEGGYRLLNAPWSAYNKQLGHALAFSHLSRRDLERWQLRGYVATYLRNHRWLDFARFCLRYRTEAAAFLRQHLFP
ncbi:MAG TPA: radical SAM protein [bacterium]|nr:radical SAM protein [bacterium]